MSSLTHESGFYDQRQTGVDTLSSRAYNFAIPFFTMLEIMIAGLAASVSYSWTFSGSGILYLLFLFGCFAAAVGGSIFTVSTDEPILSFCGGALTASAMGLMVGPFVALYSGADVFQAFVLAAGVVLLTGFIGATIPQDLAGWGSTLFGALLGLIIINFGVIIFGGSTGFAMTIIDWAVVLLFSAIMMYDMNQAQRLDKTLDNAIDVSVNVFMNFMNIFIRLLSIFGNRD